jgi:probable addiction module antidote protein
MKRKANISHDKAIVRELRDNPGFAAEYLRAALEDDDEPGVLLVALRRIAEARGGIAKIAKAAGIERESLYRALSVRGNSPPFYARRCNQGRRTEAHGRIRTMTKI